MELGYKVPLSWYLELLMAKLGLKPSNVSTFHCSNHDLRANIMLNKCIMN